MEYTYYICDVFTTKRFSGNQLAVIPDARGLNGASMQAIAREFNFSETTFVFPPEGEGTRKVRIFTPANEVPFAGHPNIGTAFVLATIGELGDFGTSLSITFEEKAGPVPVTLERLDDGSLQCELTAPEALSVGEALTIDVIASALGLTPADIVSGIHPPQVASVGLPFIVVQVKDAAALERAGANLPLFESIHETGVMPDIFVYAREGTEIRARMFAPRDGVPEDPATGSAGCAMAALLADCDREADGELVFEITQGVEMGRPSRLRARVQKEGGLVKSVRIAGRSVLVSKGSLFFDKDA